MARSPRCQIGAQASSSTHSHIGEESSGLPTVMSVGSIGKLDHHDMMPRRRYSPFLASRLVLLGACLVIVRMSLTADYLIGSQIARTLDQPVSRETLTTASLFEPKEIQATADDGPWPRIVWLMSFPNSGTSYTGQLIKQLSQTKSGTNYGENNLNNDGESVPIYEDNWNGPFWVEPDAKTKRNFTVPTKYVLTKTHCGGRCSDCGPEDYVESTHSFRRRCFATHFRRFNTTGKYEKGEYDESALAKAIHVIRNPFDNVVSRFNFDQKRMDERLKGIITKSRDGFRAYCEMMDKKYLKQEQDSVIFDERIMSIMKDVPCRSDFFRYVEWHNLAFVTTQDLDVPTMTLHYEDYETHFEEKAKDLLEFLELEPIGSAPKFVTGKAYSQAYYTRGEREAVKEAFQSLSLSVTWSHIERYFS